MGLTTQKKGDESKAKDGAPHLNIVKVAQSRRVYANEGTNINRFVDADGAIQRRCYDVAAPTKTADAN